MINVTDSTADTQPTYEAEVVAHRNDGRVDKQSTSGRAKATAAWLRALADEIDPPRPAMRGVARVEPA